MPDIKDIKINESNKSKKVINTPSPIVDEEKKLTPSEEFLLECDDEESKIFEQLKDVLTSKCDKHEFEAVTQDNLEDFAMIITYIKNGIISIESDGIDVKLRKPLNNSKSQFITDSIKLLYERNTAREKQFRNSIKTPEKNKAFNEEVSLAVVAASFANVEAIVIGMDSARVLKNTNSRDYMLLLNCYNFFRN